MEGIQRETRARHIFIYSLVFAESRVLSVFLCFSEISKPDDVGKALHHDALINTSQNVFAYFSLEEREKHGGKRDQRLSEKF